ncbi:ATP-dependent zinc metalloprotease FtsH [Amycolatopsis sp. BJA-103]|uniref:ATP-dependent zinc metalloprotease FtsH n=1 Tax=unclassified Amycolatopsis TaxID=2618356 RepID=UPI000C764122|nr:ATP-dependent zinc metalloprotease FtsH [Amycolatopsis sp. BJA-103]AUI62156.1 cell division protein FtsH [Amycolatopsis sp. BJA-103]PNE20543.1 cell division protein FtsH [Amycolatopsis sp. BJA-103]
MNRKSVLKNPVLWILAAVLAFLAYNTIFDSDRGYTQVPISIANQQITANNVKEASQEDKEQQIKLLLTKKIEVEGQQVDQIIAQYPANVAGNIYGQLIGLKNGDNPVKFTTKVTQQNVLTQILIFAIPLALVLGLLMWMMNNAQGGGNRVLNFGKSKAKQLNKDMPKTTFGDVAGADEAVEELYEIKDFLQNPARYQALGAKIPKGVLLYGPPGTGKTLLARAVAGEAGVPFYTISGSDFVEMFVGVGASRVRDLFEQAKQNAPCIIFVDEIDAVGRQRGAGLGGGHDEREQTLNQLLVEMDGFDARGGIILIAATNRPDILDPALLRPGRFDRQIPVSAPDMRGRRAILEVHAKGKPIAQGTDLSGLAKRTVGMSGADLANVLNEAALLTARQNGHVITDEALEESVDRVVGGPARKSRIISEKEKKITAYHEGGHALAAWAMPDIEPVYKLTILPRGRTGGHALLVPEDDKELMTRSEMIGRLVFAMGGRTAEELVFHEPTTGASSDIEQATKIARAMVTEYGMSARLGAVKYGQEQGDPFLGRSAGRQADYSLEVAHEIDEEVRKLIETAHTEAWHVLSTYRDVLDELVIELLEKETLTRKDLERIFATVEKRPHITIFNEFGERKPSDKPPIKTPGELAMERGEPWPPPEEKKEQPVLQPAPTPVGTAQGGGDLPGGPPYAAPVPPPDPNANPYAPPQPGAYPNGGRPNGGPNGTGHWPQAYGGQQPGGPAGGYQGGPVGGPPNYGAPPGWTPATQPGGQPNQPWRPAEDRPRDTWFGGEPGQPGGQQDEGQQRRDDGQDDTKR